MAAIAIGDEFGCARRVSGEVRCWGRNQEGQLGTGGFAEVEGANRVLDDALTISAGRRHACAVRVGGKVSCWGANDREQVSRQAGDWAAPIEVPLPYPAVEVAAGWTTSCAREADGDVWCWGDDVPLPRPIPGVSAVALANGRTPCALEADGDVACWTGVVPTKYAARAQLLAVNREIAVISDGRVLLWTVGGEEAREVGRVANATGLAVVRGGVYASSRNGELWGFPTGEGAVPLPVGRGEEIAGRGHSACARADGTIRCWGPDAAGLVSLGVLRPRPVVELPRIGVRVPFSCALGDSGVVHCKEGAEGEWQTIAGLPPVTRVAVGTNIACAAHGGVWCWNQWRDGSMAATAPMGVGVTDAAEIAVGLAHGCALTTSGSVACWGANDRGQLGDGTTRGRTSAAVVSLPLAARSLTLGPSHSCATLVDEAHFCWGDPRAFGQRGEENAADELRTAPVHQR